MREAPQDFARNTAHEKEAQPMKPWLNWALFMVIFVVVIHGIAVNSMMFITRIAMGGGEANRKHGSEQEPAVLSQGERFLLGAPHHLLPGRHWARRYGPKRQSKAAHPGLRPDPRDRAGCFYRRSHGAGYERRPRRLFAFAIRYGGTARAGEGEASREVHPRGVLTLDAAIAEQGKYLLKVAFGEAKTKDDIIEIPIMVGQ